MNSNDKVGGFSDDFNDKSENRDEENEMMDDHYQPESDDEYEEEDLDDIKVISSIYTHDSISKLLIDILTNFEKFSITYEQLPIIANMVLVLKERKKYSAKGYFYIILRERVNEGNSNCLVITIDQDGLRLSHEGYVTEDDELGGDSYGTDIFPCDADDEAWDTINRVENFTSNFLDMLQNDSVEREILDSGDGVEVID